MMQLAHLKDPRCAQVRRCAEMDVRTCLAAVRLTASPHPHSPMRTTTCIGVWGGGAQRAAAAAGGGENQGFHGIKKGAHPKSKVRRCAARRAAPTHISRFCKPRRSGVAGGMRRT